MPVGSCRTTSPTKPAPWWWLCLAAAALACLPSAALAQRLEVKIESVRWGWQGVMPADRFAPVRVVLSSGDQASSGIVQLEFDQDPTQRGRVSAAYATTPGLSTPVELTAALPRSASNARVTVIDLSGRGPRVVATRTISGVFDGGPEVISDRAIVPTWGRSSLPRAWRTLADPSGVARALPDATLSEGSFGESDRPAPDGRLRREQRLMVTPAEDVPGSIGAWSAYDGVELVVVGAMGEARLDPRTLDAVRAWVLSGGRLVIVAEPAGDGWRRWLPEGPAFDVASVGDLAPVPGPAELRGVLDALRISAEAPPPDRGRMARDELIDEWHKQLRELNARAFEPAASVRARTITLTQRGVAAGWRTRWALGETAALIAEGPIGFGFVTIVGVDPELALAEVSAPGLRAAWGSAARTILDRDGGWMSRSVAPEWRWGFANAQSFEGDPEAGRAVWSAIDRSVRGQGLRVDVGAEVFFGIAGCVVVLALLLGPIDALVLKRLGARSLAWASALFWIGLASVAGVMIPTLMRSGESSAGRFSEADVLLEPSGAAGAREVASSAALAWDASVGTIFAGRPERFTLEDDGLGRVSRGISAISNVGQSSAFRSFAPHDAMEASVGLEPGPARALGVGTIRGSRASGLDLGQWMLRSVMDTGVRPADAGLGGDGGLSSTARIDDTPDGPALVIELRGLPAAATLSGAWVRLGPGLGRVVVPEVWSGEGRVRLTVRTPSGEADPGTRRMLGFVPGPVPPGQDPTPGGAFTEPQPAAMSLWGARSRSLAHETRAASGRYAVVLVELTGLPMDVTPRAGEQPKADEETGTFVRRSQTNLKVHRDARVRLSVPIPAESSRVWSGKTP